MRGVQIDGWLRASYSDIGEQAHRLEQLGFDGAFSFEGSHDAFLPLALAAESTERILLMTNIAVGLARSPMDLAQTANDLQLASRGRFALGLGSQIRPHIQKRYSMAWSSPVERMAELVSAIRAIQSSWSDGSRLDFRGDHYHHTLMTPFFSPGPNPYGAPPIFMAGLGPRMTAKAAEIADGLLVHPFNTELYVREHTAPSVDAGLTAGGGRREGFTVAITCIVATWRSEAEAAAALDGVRRLLAFYGSTPAYRVVLEAHGWGDLQTELNALSKQGRWEEMANLIDDEVLRTIAVTGDPMRAAAEVQRRYAGLADRISFSTPYEIHPDTTAALVGATRSAAATG